MIMLVEKIIYNVFFFFFRVTNRIKKDVLKSKLGLFEEGANIEQPQTITCPQKVFLHKRATILHGAKIIISPNEGGRLIIKENSGAAQGLTVITGNHQRPLGVFFKDVSASHHYDINKDVIVEEDVWIGAGVTLIAGVTVGRGATVGAGSVCLKSVPPYAVVMGNPAKVVGFNFTPEEIIEHEKALYPEEERLPLDLLEKNYNKYFISRIKEIKEFTRLSL